MLTGGMRCHVTISPLVGAVAVDCRTFCYMIGYLFTATGFPPGGSGRLTGMKVGKREHKRRDNTQNNTRTQNRKQKCPKRIDFFQVTNIMHF